MKNTPYEGSENLRLPRQLQLQRIQRVIREELTPLQQQTIFAYYFQEMTLEQIAEERQVHRSTVSRTLKRAEKRLKRYLQY